MVMVVTQVAYILNITASQLAHSRNIYNFMHTGHIILTEKFSSIYHRTIL